ncbi:hypothetical protein SAMN05216328_1322 [Ensifer sp. YR511]|nr:hypothetical protein SAMN05216328_1322 [Ensifer sp. YR511]
MPSRAAVISDHGTEFTSNAMLAWSEEKGGQAHAKRYAARPAHCSRKRIVAGVTAGQQVAPVRAV